MPSKAELVCVPPEKTGEMWPHVRKLLEQATEACGEWTIDQLERAVCAGRQLLWLTWDGEAIQAACVTEIIETPQGRACLAVACGGTDENWPKRLEPIENYAKGAGCEFMRIQGREGWRRVFKEYRFEWVSLVKRLD
jgi:hypothetical protein